MRTLAIDSATESCSAALFEGENLLAGYCEVIGRGHAERLVPMIAELPDRGHADRILVSLGPGSFTGVRIGLAAARALALAWKVEVLGYPTLALVAAMARIAHPGSVTVCMTGGHGEWFVQDFSADGLPVADVCSLPPAEAAGRKRSAITAGSQAASLISLGGSGGEAIEILPDARSAMLVPASLLTSSIAPLYGRPPDARLPGQKP